MSFPVLILAAAGQPLFGNVWLALLSVVAGIALFLLAIAGVGRWLAATHPDPVPSSRANDSLVVGSSPAPETIAAIAAAVIATIGGKARIAAVRLVPPPAPSVEALMQQWSLEGRRQIYGSHKVR